MYYKDTNIHNYLWYDSVHPESCKKNIPYSLAKIIIVIVTDPGKVKLRLNELKFWLKIINILIVCISNAFYNGKLQGSAPKSKFNFNNIPFVITFYEDTDNKIIMKNIKRKIEKSHLII